MSNYILTRIEAIQQELEMLKQKVLTQEQSEVAKLITKDEVLRNSTDIETVWD